MLNTNVDALACRCAQGDDAKSGLHAARQSSTPAPGELGLHGHGLYGVDSSDGFHQKRLTAGAAIELLSKSRAQDRRQRIASEKAKMQKQDGGANQARPHQRPLLSHSGPGQRQWNALFLREDSY